MSRVPDPPRRLALTVVHCSTAGDDLAGRHGTTTTTDWGMLSSEECYAAVDDEGVEGQFETAHLFDADDAASKETM